MHPVEEHTAMPHQTTTHKFTHSLHKQTQIHAKVYTHTHTQSTHAHMHTHSTSLSTALTPTVVDPMPARAFSCSVPPGLSMTGRSESSNTSCSVRFCSDVIFFAPSPRPTNCAGKKTPNEEGEREPSGRRGGEKQARTRWICKQDRTGRQTEQAVVS